MTIQSSPATLRGSRPGEIYPVPADAYVLIGRDARSDVVLGDDTVSRRHAALRRHDGAAWLEDLASTGGTWVNGQRVTGEHRLTDGDRLRLGGFELRYVASGKHEDGTEVLSPVPGQAPPDPAARFDVHDQRAGTINNVGRDQYLSYVAHIEQQRESFGREIAATKTKARWLVWLGALATVVGTVMSGSMVLQMIQAIWSSVAAGLAGDSTPPNFGDLLKPGAFGLSWGLIGFALAGLGELLLIVGIALHIVATARRRRVERDLPLPAPPAGLTPRSPR